MKWIGLIVLLVSPGVFAQCIPGIGVEAQQEFLRCQQQQQQLDRIERNTRQQRGTSSARQAGEILGEAFSAPRPQSTGVASSWAWMDAQVRQPGVKDRIVDVWFACLDEKIIQGLNADDSLSSCSAKWAEACMAIVSNAYLGQAALAERDSMFGRCLMPEQWIGMVAEKVEARRRR